MADDKILLVDDDPVSIRVMSRVLASYPNLQFATSGEDALRLAGESPPDLILLDAEMPDMSGFQVCEALKRHPVLANVAVIFVTTHSEPEFEVAGLDIGAVDFISKPVSPPLVLARVRTQLRMKHMADELRRITTIDSLTGVANRRAFDEGLDAEWRRTLRSAKPLSLLMVDVDQFEAYNNRHGHAAGDACLARVAKALQGAMLRPADRVARFGDAVFAVLLPETDSAGAQRVAHRLLDTIEALAIAHGASTVAGHITVSIGVSSFDQDSADWSAVPVASRFDGGHGAAEDRSRPADLLLAAAKALTSAKLAGRARAHWLSIDALHTEGEARDVLVVVL